MNEYTPTLIGGIIMILAFIVCVIYNSYVTNDPYLMRFIEMII